MTQLVGYMVVYSDNASTLYRYGIPEPSDCPRVLYRSVADAKRAAISFITSFESSSLVAYGEAFPYENVRLEDVLEREGSATVGWGLINAEDEEDDGLRIGIAIVAIYSV